MEHWKNGPASKANNNACIDCLDAILTDPTHADSIALDYFMRDLS